MTKSENENKLKLIPKAETYVEYIINMIIKLPRTEKFNIGTEYKQSMYKMLSEIMYLNKMDKTSNNSVIIVLNKIDRHIIFICLFL